MKLAKECLLLCTLSMQGTLDADAMAGVSLALHLLHPSLANQSGSH
jgi:hypothetical protein